MNLKRIQRPLSIVLIFVGGFVYIWPLVAGASASYPINSPLQVIGPVLLFLSLCISGGAWKR
ncbi:MAG: hypothetical protein ACTSV2_02480 [Candidatus Thorarchaeota archaeon]